MNDSIIAINLKRIENMAWVVRKYSIYILLSLVLTLFAPDLNNLIGGAPVWEELAKAATTTISPITGLIYTVIFAVTEFIHYIDLYKWEFDLDGQGTTYVWLRIACIVDHLVFLSIHIISWRKARSCETKLEKVTWRLNGYIAAVMVHWFYNNVLTGIMVRVFLM